MSLASEVCDRICQEARTQFFRFGFSKVTMDDLARELGISKKTIYLHFPTKSELLRAALLGKVEEIAAGLDKIIGQPSIGSVEKLRQVMIFMLEALPDPTGLFLSDLRKKVPQIWKEVAERRDATLRTQFGRLIAQGVAEGKIRSDIDPAFLLRILSVLTREIINPDVLSHLPLTARQAYQALASVVFEGLLTEEGRAIHVRSDSPGEGAL